LSFSRTPESNGYIRTDNLAGAVQEVQGGLEVGARVRITGLQKQQHLNSAMGILVKFHGDRWQVRRGGQWKMKLDEAWEVVPGALGRGLGRQVVSSPKPDIGIKQPCLEWHPTSAEGARGCCRRDTSKGLSWARSLPL